MESAALSGLTSLVTSNVTNGWLISQGFPNDGQKMMLYIVIVSLVCWFCCSVSVSILQSNANYEAGTRCFQGLITIFSALTVAMLSACFLPWYFKLFSCFFCCIPVLVHTVSDTRWFRDWFPKPTIQVLPIYHPFRSSPECKWSTWASKIGGVFSKLKTNPIVNISTP